jgi:hypothetical protein
MRRTSLPWLRGAWGLKSAGRTVARRRPFFPRVLILEQRTLPSVQFTPAPYAVPANRPDTPLTHIVRATPVEPYLSVNPVDPGGIAVSSHFGMRVSTTAGGNFAGESQFPGSTGGDTSSVYDSAGRLFWVNLTSPGGFSGVSIAQVDPGTGGILSTHVVDQEPDSSLEDDKDFIAADPSNGNLYVIWTLFASGFTQVMMRYSSDQGVSWSAPVRVDNGENFAWPVTVTVAPDHHVYAAYHAVADFDATGAPDHSGAVVVVRYDSDLTNPMRSMAEVPGRADITFNVQTTDRTIRGAQFWIQGDAQPWIMADPVRPGNIYVISADSNNGFNQDYGDIRIARSTDYGQTWSSNLIENSSTFFPNAAIDQFGDIVVAWYDNRRSLDNAAGHFKLDVYATYSTDGGLTFAPDFPVNDQTPGVNTPDGNTFDPDPGAVDRYPGPPPTTRIGEYFGIGIWGGTAYVAWNGNTFAGFNRPVDQQVWTKAFAIQGSLTVTGTSGNDVISIRSILGNPDAVEVIVNGHREYAGLWSALTGITVNATPGDDLVLIDDTVAGTPVTVNFGNGTDSLVVSGTASDLSTIQGTVIVHGGGSGSLVTLRDESNNADTGYAITGSSVTRSGAAMITYDNLGRGMRVVGGTGNDTFNILGTLPGTVGVTGGAGSNTLTIDNGSNTGNTTYTIMNTSIAWTGSTSMTYSGITNLVLTGGSGNNTYNLLSGEGLLSTALNTGSGANTVNVRSSGTPVFIRSSGGPLSINSGGGGNTITLSNSAATLNGIGHVTINDPSHGTAVTADDSGFTDGTAYTLTSTQVAAAWPNFLLTYTNPANLHLQGSSGNDTFDIEGTAGTTATTVTGASGSNRFDITPTNQYLAAIAGPLTLVGSGADTLVFSDQANPNAETYTFDDVPSMLALATVPTFDTNWSGMGSVYLETNGISTVNDPSGAVLVDTPPPSPPPSPGGGISPPLGRANLLVIIDLSCALACGTLVPSDASAIASLAAPPLLDWLFASITGEEFGLVALEVPFGSPRA